MKAFRGAREAKEFLISRIVLEAQRENVSLSDAERKMLYFSETDWTLPDIQDVADEFNRNYDQDDYEARIAGLIKRAYRSVSKAQGDDYDRWWSAVRVLGTQDHYILVMIRKAGLRPRGDQLKLLAAGLGIVILLLCIMFPAHFVIERYGARRYFPSDEATGFYMWAAALCFAVVYVLFGWLKRKTALGSFLLNLFSRANMRSNRNKNAADH